LSTARWEHFQHQADIGVRGLGPSIETAFEQAALALTAVIIEPARVACIEEYRIECEAPDPELLLADWLNALVFRMAVERMLFGRFRVRIHGGQLLASAWGEPLDPDRHQPAVEIKGATYTGLRVARSADGGWLAQCVVDV
jgi:tRNA nucleotidyltransferase (CCA-adding enzyme)